jgi:hypothetical protein
MGEKDINTELWHGNYLEDWEGDRMLKEVAKDWVQWWWALESVALNLLILLPELVDYDTHIFLLSY